MRVSTVVLVCLSACAVPPLIVGDDTDGGGPGGTDSDTASGLDDSDADQDGYSVADGDCDDTDADIHPDAVDLCNQVDDNCDGDADEGSEWEVKGRVTDNDGVVATYLEVWQSHGGSWRLASGRYDDDADGQDDSLVSSTFAKGNRTRRQTDRNADGTDDLVESWNYDAKGQLQTSVYDARDAGYSIEYASTYDADGTLVSRTLTDGTGEVLVVLGYEMKEDKSGRPLTVRTTADRSDAATAGTYPILETYVWNENDRLVSYARDLLADGSPELVERNRYNRSGDIVSSTEEHDGLSSGWTSLSDKDGRDTDGTIDASYAYTYAPTGLTGFSGDGDGDGVDDFVGTLTRTGSSYWFDEQVVKDGDGALLERTTQTMTCRDR